MTYFNFRVVTQSKNRVTQSKNRVTQSKTSNCVESSRFYMYILKNQHVSMNRMYGSRNVEYGYKCIAK